MTARALALKDIIGKSISISTPELANKNNLPLLPIDSEHSAIWQCLRGEEDNKVKNALVFGLEHHSLGLARDLQKENYVIEIAYIQRPKNVKHITDLKIHFLKDLNVECLEAINIQKFETIIYDCF